jgi:hypothetical protein
VAPTGEQLEMLERIRRALGNPPRPQRREETVTGR